MHKKASGGNRSATVAGGLSFKRETVRRLTASEAKQIAGGRICQSESCLGDSCPNSVCTITLDKTI